jgi:hypothetical protein
MPILLPDSDRIQESKRGSAMAPFAVFGIILGCGIILVQLLPMFGKFEPSVKTEILNISVLVSSGGGFISTLAFLRSWLRGSWVDRIMYLSMAGIYLVLAICYGVILQH